MLRPDLVLTNIRQGEYIAYTINYFEEDGVTPTTPNSVAASVFDPSGTTTEYTTSPYITGSGNTWTVNIPTTAKGDWFTEIQATWGDDFVTFLIYAPVAEGLGQIVFTPSGFSSGFSEGFN